MPLFLPTMSSRPPLSIHSFPRSSPCFSVLLLESCLRRVLSCLSPLSLPPSFHHPTCTHTRLFPRLLLLHLPTAGLSSFEAKWGKKEGGKLADRGSRARHLRPTTTGVRETLRVGSGPARRSYTDRRTPRSLLLSPERFSLRERSDPRRRRQKEEKSCRHLSANNKPRSMEKVPFLRPRA